MGVLGFISAYLSYQTFIEVVLDNLFFIKKGLFKKSDEKQENSALRAQLGLKTQFTKEVDVLDTIERNRKNSLNLYYSRTDTNK